MERFKTLSDLMTYYKEQIEIEEALHVAWSTVNVNTKPDGTEYKYIRSALENAGLSNGEYPQIEVCVNVKGVLHSDKISINPLDGVSRIREKVHAKVKLYEDLIAQTKYGLSRLPLAYSYISKSVRRAHKQSHDLLKAHDLAEAVLELAFYEIEVKE